MSKKRARTKRNRSPKPLRTALSTALLAGAVLAPAAPVVAKDPSLNLTIVERVANVREALGKRSAQCETGASGVTNKLSYEEAEIAQWGNWGNWGNWNNWNNFANWGNWANWSNWGNF